MVEKERRDWTDWLQQQRRIVLKVILTALLILGAIGVITELVRELINDSYNIKLATYSIAYLFLLSLALIKKIPDLWRAIGLLALLYGFGLFALYIGWLQGGGRLFLLSLIVMTAVLIHPRITFIIACLVLATYIFYGLAFTHNWLNLRQQTDPLSTPTIVIEGVGLFMVTAMVSLALWYFGRALMAADHANLEAQEARIQLDEHAHKLEEANTLIAKQAEASLHDSETKLHNVIQQATDAIYLCNERGQITNWNIAAEKISGISNQEAIGKKVWEIQSQILVDERGKTKNANDLRKMIIDTLKTGKSELYDRPLEGEIKNRDGSRRYFQQLAFPIQTAKGFMLGTIIRDITDKKQIEIEREELIKKLESKNAELERFTYTVSHDLKSPLITIQGFLGYIEKDAASGNTDRFGEDIQRINNAVGKMHRLLNELLELSRIGRLMNPPEDIPFGSIVREAITITEGRLKEHNVQIEVAPDLPTVNGDRTRLVEVIQNLIDNAAKFMGAQPHPLIQIGIRKSSNQISFYVQDNGIGIEPQYQEKVFGLFNKLDTQSEGTGVGLSLVKRIIDVHNGQIWIESEGFGKGTTVLFTLPISPENKSETSRRKK